MPYFKPKTTQSYQTGNTVLKLLGFEAG